jgi:Spx/MgsR family transcriptional regulator
VASKSSDRDFSKRGGAATKGHKRPDGHIPDPLKKDCVMILYGIPTCDTCRKARKALEAAGQDVTFRDLRADPLAPEDIARFHATFGDKLLNRASTTWRGLDEATRAQPVAELLAAHPTLIKRPIIEGEALTLGWDKAAQATQLPAS